MNKWDYLGLDPWTTKEDAIKAAALEVYFATQASVQLGKAEYKPDLSQTHLDTLLQDSVDKFLSRGANHLSGYNATNREIRTIYGVEYWTFVCCDETETWSFHEIKRGDLPVLRQLLDNDEMALGHASPDLAEWQYAKSNNCIFVHSHNILYNYGKSGNGENVSKSIVLSSILSEPDKKLGERFNIQIIAVSDDNFNDVTGTPVAIPVVDSP